MTDVTSRRIKIYSRWLTYQNMSSNLLWFLNMIFILFFKGKSNFWFKMSWLFFFCSNLINRNLTGIYDILCWRRRRTHSKVNIKQRLNFCFINFFANFHWYSPIHFIKCWYKARICVSYIFIQKNLHAMHQKEMKSSQI